MTTIQAGPSDLPVIPLPRDPRCPLHPPAEFDAWRNADGLQRVMWHGQQFWVVSRHSDIRQALTDPRVSADFSTFEQEYDGDVEVPLVFARMDDPEHNRLRRMMTSDFTARRIAAMRPHIQELVDGFLQTMVEKGAPADLVRDFALPIPSMVICRLLGVPYADHEFFEVNSAKSLDMSSTEEERIAASGAVYEYIGQLLRRKRSEPGDDLITRLAARVEQGECSHATAAMTGFIMLQAGHETTASMIALGALTLLQHPEAFERLSATDDPEVIANAVDELMRYLSIVHSLIERKAREDLAIGGQQIRAGDLLLMNIPAGNWDPEFTDDPDVFDIDRNSRGHVAFGYGVHQCIGINLARAELQIALSTLVHRLPGLQLAVPPEQLEFKSDHAIYGIRELPVTW
jgi:cytochrome P450